MASGAIERWPSFRLSPARRAQIEALGPVLRATEAEAEQGRHLPMAAVTALQSSELLRQLRLRVARRVRAGRLVVRIPGAGGPAGWSPVHVTYPSPDRLGPHRLRAGVGERALEEVTALAVGKRRTNATQTVADRGAFQRDLGHAYT